MNNLPFLPVLLGGDVGAYGLARSFHEMYGAVSYVFEIEDLMATRYSKIVNRIIIKDLEKEDVFISTLIEFAKANANKKLILLAFRDTFAELMIKNKKILEEYYILPCIDNETFKRIGNKEAFYKLCDEFMLDYPNTYILKYDKIKESYIELQKFVENNQFPVVLKPSNSALFWQTDLPRKKKVYIIYSLEELYTAIEQIYNSDYNDNLIIQEFIPGDDVFSLHCYSNQQGKVSFMSLANVLLDEPGALGIGSPVAILTSYNEKLLNICKFLLEEISYIGFSNIDFKYDKRDNKFKFLEINLRPGRSIFFANQGPYALSKYVVNDYIFNTLKLVEINKLDNLWCIVPYSFLLDNIKNKEKLDKCIKLIKNNQTSDTFDYKYDLSSKRVNLLYNKLLSYKN